MCSFTIFSLPNITCLHSLKPPFHHKKHLYSGYNLHSFNKYFKKYSYYKLIFYYYSIANPSLSKLPIPFISLASSNLFSAISSLLKNRLPLVQTNQLYSYHIIAKHFLKVHRWKEEKIQMFD